MPGGALLDRFAIVGIALKHAQSRSFVVERSQMRKTSFEVSCLTLAWFPLSGTRLMRRRPLLSAAPSVTLRRLEPCDQQRKRGFSLLTSFHFLGNRARCCSHSSGATAAAGLAINRQSAAVDIVARILIPLSSPAKRMPSPRALRIFCAGTITGIAGCCARAASGPATTAPLKQLTKYRRLIGPCSRVQCARRDRC